MHGLVVANSGSGIGGGAVVVVGAVKGKGSEGGHQGKSWVRRVR